MSSAVQKSPHVVVASTVTASVEKRSLFRKLINEIMPEAVADVIGTLWDPESGQPPTNSDVGLVNNYYDNSSLYGCDSGTTGRSSTGGGPCSGTYSFAYTGPNSTGSKIPTSVSIKDYIGQQLDPNFVNANGSSTSTFGRLQSSLQIVCALGYVFSPTDTDGTPQVTSGTAVTLPTDTSSPIYKSVSDGGCGLSATQMAGESLGTVVVTAVTGSSYYTKELNMTSPGSTGNAIKLFIGLNLTAGTLNFMQIEDQANGAQGRNAVDRSILSMTGVNGTPVLKFEYSSMGFSTARNSSPSCWTAPGMGGGDGWSCSYEFHRIFIDSVNDVAYLITNDGSPGDSSGLVSSSHAPVFYTQFTGAAKPNELSACTSTSCSQTLALSVGFAGQQNNPATGTDYNACVNASTRDVSLDGSLACSATGTTVGAGSASGVIELSRQFLSTSPNVILNTSATTTVSFTGASDFFTAATSQ
jgi:hypothetical protein